MSPSKPPPPPHPLFNTLTPDPHTKGIQRPTAQRLSLSLSVAPLVGQRSLLFRVQSDVERFGEDVYYHEVQSMHLYPSMS